MIWTNHVRNFQSATRHFLGEFLLDKFFVEPFYESMTCCYHSTRIPTFSLPSLRNGCKDNPDSWFWQDFVSSRACATSQVLLANRLLRDQHASSGGDKFRCSKRVFGLTSKSKDFSNGKTLWQTAIFDAFWGSSWSLGETCSQVRGCKALLTAKY